MLRWTFTVVWHRISYDMRRGVRCDRSLRVTLFTSSVQFYCCCHDYVDAAIVIVLTIPSPFPHNECCYHYQPFFPFGLNPLCRINKLACTVSSIEIMAWTNFSNRDSHYDWIFLARSIWLILQWVLSFHYYELDRSFLCVYPRCFSSFPSTIIK